MKRKAAAVVTAIGLLMLAAVPDGKPGPLELGFDYYFGVPVLNCDPPFVNPSQSRNRLEEFPEVAEELRALLARMQTTEATRPE